MVKQKLGVIGGSGIYDLHGIQNPEWTSVDTPYGSPSDDVYTGNLNGTEIVFLPRHGRGHIHSPTSVPYRANIFALKKLGVTDIISLSACGSLREDYKPGDFVVVDQFIDRTFRREKSFFGQGCVAHVSMAQPTCERLGELCKTAMDELGLTYHSKGTYIAMEGPQFSTRGESLLYKDVWHCDVIGMTNMPEAKLAREAEICYASIAMVTDYDCWHSGHDDVQVSDIIRTLTQNAQSGKSLITKLSEMLGSERNLCEFGCNTALDNALITHGDNISEEVKMRLQPIISRLSS